MMRLKILMVAAVILVAASCQKYDPDPEFISGTTVCLKVDGKTIHTYNPLTWQASYKTKVNEYRVFSDDMSEYYCLTCSEKPTRTGQTITGTVRWSGSSKSDESSRSKVSFTVQKIDSSTGKIWLWSTKKNIGVAVIDCQ